MEPFGSKIILNIFAGRVFMARSSIEPFEEVFVMNDPRSAPMPSRRRSMAMIAAAGALAATLRSQTPSMQTPSMAEKPSNPAHQALTALHYEIDFKASPQRFYDAILDQKQFAAFTGMPATIDPTAGGAFSQFGGMIVGRNLELVPAQRIVQGWRPSHWDAGVYSIVHFELKPRGTDTTLVFDHIGFPAGEYDHLDGGWQGHYWQPLKKYFA
jgi:activator of HSP90 ATPase